MRALFAAWVLIAAADAAQAQAPPGSGGQTPAGTINQTSQTTASPSPSAVQTNSAVSRTAAAPVAGRNSFTRGEARRRMTQAGFSGVQGLALDRSGIWRAQARKDGAAVAVALDYQGNVVAQ